MADTGLLQSMGAQPSKPTKYVPLSTQKFFTGLWTQRSPFNSPDTRYVTRYLGVRSDILINGSNMELTNYNTLIRRPGTTPYSSATVNGNILDFYAYRQYLPSSPNPIDVIVDTTVEVDKLTPTAKTLIYTKGTGAGQASFQGVAGQASFQGFVQNTLYIGDGARQSAWADSTQGISGTVNTSGTSVTWVSGPNFPTDGSWNGISILINSVFYVVSVVTSITTLTLVSTAGTQTGVNFTVEIRNWGIAIGAVTGNGPNSPSSGIDVPVSGGIAWANPGNITAADGAFATVTVPVAASLTSLTGNSPYPSGQVVDPTKWQTAGGEWRTIGGNGTSTSIQVTNFGLAVPTGSIPVGVSFQFGATQQNNGGGNTVISNVSLTYAGSALGTAKTPGTALGTAPGNTLYPFGANNDPWGLNQSQLTQSVVNDPSFGYIVTFALSNLNRTFFSATFSGFLTVYYLVPTPPSVSDYLEALNFGFSGLPLGVPISGFFVEVEGLQQSAVGVVSTSGITVTWISGSTFVTSGSWNGLTITINGVPYVIASVDSSISLTLTTSAGTQASVAYTIANPFDSDLIVGILAAGAPVGQSKPTQLNGSNTFITLGGSNDDFVTGLMTTDVMQTNFGVYLQGSNSDAFISASYSVDFVRITVYFGGAPGIAVSGTAGSMSAVNGGYSYAQAYGNSNSGHVSSASPNSASTGSFSNKLGVVVTLVASNDPQVNQIWVFRTTDGGATNVLFNIPGSPFPNVSGNITDSAPDVPNVMTSVALNQQLQAALSPFNNPPPTGLTKIEYYMGRMWGAVGNILYFSLGPEVTIGNGNEAFPPAFNMAFPTQIARLVPLSSGLLVFTADDIWIVLGTSSFTFYAIPYLTGVGLLSQNALDLQGNQIFMYTSDKQGVSLTQSGSNEIGFGIGNLLQASFNPTTMYVASLIDGTSDKAVYFGDGSTGWYRCNWNQPPEGGPAWSPKATIVGGAGALAAIEISPGQHKLLIGQGSTVLLRDSTTNVDNGTTYPAFLTFGSLVLAQPGQLAEAESITVELPNIGTQPLVSVLLDEINGLFENLPYNVPDPPILAPSTSLISRRFYFSSGQLPVVFRHLQIQLTFASENAANELYTLSIWGALHSKE